MFRLPSCLILFDLINQVIYLVKSTNYEAPHFSVFLIIFLDSLSSGHTISASLSYVTARGEEKMERAGGSKAPCTLLLLLPPSTSAGWPVTCAFVTVNAVRRYLATSLLRSNYSSQHIFLKHFQSVFFLWEERTNFYTRNNRIKVLIFASKI
jgi:hypothetical protein